MNTYEWVILGWFEKPVLRSLAKVQFWLKNESLILFGLATEKYPNLVALFYY
jgi:hypothetical protein